MKQRLEPSDIERIVRDVLTSVGTPFTLSRVEQTPRGWTVTLQNASGQHVAATFPDGPPATVRRTIIEFVNNAE